ncbi:hypothetical protein COOONC_21618 [Cooperia oncophora]
MLTDCFRSEPEVQASYNVSNCVPFQFSNDPEAVVFYSSRYENDLLMKYLGESGSVESVDESSAEFTNYGSFGDELPSYCYIDPTRSPDCLREQISYSDEVMMSADSPASFASDFKPLERPVTPQKAAVPKPNRRGRPMKVTSTSKMANYARNYREQKKNQLAACEAQVRELTEENKYLRAENKRLTEGYARLSAQVDSLRKMIESNSYSSRDPLQTPNFSGPAYDKDFSNDLFDITELMTFSQ